MLSGATHRSLQCHSFRASFPKSLSAELISSSTTEAHHEQSVQVTTLPLGVTTHVFARLIVVTPQHSVEVNRVLGRSSTRLEFYNPKVSFSCLLLPDRVMARAIGSG